MRKKLLSKVMLLLAMLLVGAGNVWADDYEELYSADFTSISPAFGYSKNKEFTLSEKSWTASVAQLNAGVFYLGCNSSNSDKGTLNNNTTFSDVADALANVDSKYTKSSTQAYALLFDNAYSNVSKVSFAWNGGNNAFQVYLFADKGSGYELLASTNYATSGTGVAGSVEWSGNSTNYTKFAIVARPGTTSSTATNKTLRAASFNIYKVASPSTLTTSDLALTGAPVALSFDLYNNASAQTISYTTSSTGDVTVSESDYITAIVNNNNTITVTPKTAVTPSTQTITVSQAADATYEAGEVTFTVTVSDSDPSVATTTTIDDSGITNTNVFTGTAAGSLSATVTPGNGSVTWSSSNTGVATIAPDGTVTLVAAGTTTITASFAAVVDQYKASSATYELTVTNFDPNGPGTENNPYSVADAITAIKALSNSNATTEKYYVRGIVSSFQNTSVIGDGTNYRYYISDDGTTSTQLLVYKGKGLNEQTFTNASDLEIGDVVTIYGAFQYYNSNTPEIAANNYIVSLTRKTLPALSFETSSYTVLPGANFTTPTLTNPENVTVTYSSNDEDIAIVDENTGDIVIGTKEGTATITASFAGNDTYKANSASYTITVAKGEAELSFDAVSFTVAENASFTAPTLTNPHGLTITYSSSDEDIVLVDENNGTVVIGTLPSNEDATITITATAAANTQYKTGTATYTITVTKAAIYTASFSVNGTVTSTVDAAESAAITFPSDPESIGGKTFVGWIEEGNTLTHDNIVTSADMGSGDVTYLAVFGDVNGNTTLTKMSSSDTFTNNDNIVIVAVGTSYALYQETTNSSYVKNYTFDNNAETVKADAKNWITVTEGSTSGTWKLGDDTNGYLYTSGSNNLAVSTTNSSEFALAYDNSNDGFTLTTGGRYLSCRTDLSSNNVNLYRLGGTNTNNGVCFFDIYKFVNTVSYTNLTTSISPVTATVGATGYATFCSTTALDFTGMNIAAYIATADGTTSVNFAQVNKVPANTGVLLYAAGGKTEDIPALVGDAENVDGNVFVPGAGEAVATNPSEGTYNYVLSTDSKGENVGFYQAADKTVAVGKAYIQITTSAGVKGFIGLPDGMETAIQGIEATKQNDAIYNLNGQRVQKPVHGLYIVNGKKVLVK